jgi:hypothetical protein
MQKWLLVLILFFAVSVQAQTDRHTIKAIASGGEVIILDDGTAWNVSNSSDFFTTKYWSKDADVLVINDEKIINAETNETVDVKPVREGDSYGQGSTGTGAQNNNALINATQHEFDLGAQEGAQAVEAEKQRQFQVEEAEKQRQFEERMAREHEEAETERLKLSLGRNSESTSTSKPQNTTTAHVSESRPVIQNRLLDLSESITEDSLWLTNAHYLSGSKLLKDTVSWSKWTMSARYLLNKLIDHRVTLDSLLAILRRPSK